MNRQQLEINKVIAKGSSIVFLGMLLAKLGDFPASIIIARYFGPYDYGLLSIAWVISGVIAGVSVLGMGMGISRFIPYYREREELDQLKRILLFGAKTTLLVSLPVTFVIFFCSDWFAFYVFKDINLTPLIQIASISIPFAALLQYGTGLFRGIKKLHYIFYYNDLARPILQLFFLFVIIIAGLNILHVVISRLLVTLMILGLAFYIFAQDEIVTELRERKPRGSVREFVHYSYPLGVTVIVNFARQRFDLLLIGAFLGARDTGIYNIAISLAIILTIPLTGINRILLPVTSELYSKGRKKDLAITYKTMSRWCLTIVLPFFMVIVFFSKQIILFIFGSEYIAAAEPLCIISLGIFINVSMGSFGEFLQAHGRSRMVMAISIIGSLLNVTCLFILVPLYAMRGAALSFAISMVIMNILGVYSLMMHRIHPFSKKYFCVLLIGITLYTVLFGLLRNIVSPHLNLFWIGIAFLMSLFLYGFILFYFNGFSEEEKEMLITCRRKISPFNQRNNITNAN